MFGPDRNLDHLYPAFLVKVEQVIDAMGRYCAVHKPGYKAMMVEGYRTAGYQNQLYQQGRTTKGKVVTQRDGIRVESLHQSSLAADIIPVSVHGTIDWNPGDAWFAYLQHCAHVVGLESGLDWTGWKDEDHIQWPESDKAEFVLARNWQLQNGLRH